MFTVDAPNPFQPGQAAEVGLRCRCPVDGVVEPVQVLSEANGMVATAEVTSGVRFSKAVAFLFPDPVVRLAELLGIVPTSACG